MDSASDLQVAGSSPGWAQLRSGLLQATYTCVPLSSSSIIWYRPRGVTSLAGKVTEGLVESMTNVICGLTAENSGVAIMEQMEQLLPPDRQGPLT